MEGSVACDRTLSVVTSYYAFTRDDTMTIERQRTEGVALYARWAAMWNGELEISNEIIEGLSLT